MRFPKTDVYIGQKNKKCTGGCGKEDFESICNINRTYIKIEGKAI